MSYMEGAYITHPPRPVSTSLCRAMHALSLPSFQHPSSCSVGKADYVFPSIHMHQCNPSPFLKLNTYIKNHFNSSSIQLFYKRIRSLLTCKWHKINVDLTLYHIEINRISINLANMTNFQNASNTRQKFWFRNGTFNNSTSSHMPLDHCYTIGLLL